MSDLEYPDTAEEVTVVTWHRGDTSIVISVPHGGTIGGWVHARAGNKPSRRLKFRIHREESMLTNPSVPNDLCVWDPISRLLTVRSTHF